MSQNIRNLVWIDLEMTGLDPLQNVILEIACIITSQDLEVIAQTPSIAINHSEEVLKKMDAWCVKMHTETGLLDAVKKSSFSLQDAEQHILHFVKNYCYDDKSLLCGNSIWFDKFFLRLHMPTLYNFLHYRIIDVSTVKELIRRWYPNDPQANFKKNNSHKALEDIQESIAELKHYKKHFFKNSLMP